MAHTLLIGVAMMRSGGMMNKGKFWILVILVITTCLAGKSNAEDRYVRLKSVEGEVSIIPSDGQRGTEATMNTPLMDRDEIQTGNGRAELSFRNGIVVRVGDYSGVRLESAYTPMSIVLLQGTVFVDSHIIDRFQDELTVRAGDAEVFLLDEGNIRVDLGNEGSVRVTTIQGQAEVQAAGRRVLLNSGDRTYVDPGKEPERPEQFNGQTDELDDWNASGMESYAGNDYSGGYEGGDYVDQDIYYDAQDLGGYGDWRYSGSEGYVWVPNVEYGWRPYYDGRWSYANNSWFWVSYEPWGWAPYHYGRWGWSLSFGWYWIPGTVFGPSWVSWYNYGDYIGWCPLNYYNYPIYYDHYDRDYGYPPIQKDKTLNTSNSWTFVKKGDIGVSDIKKKVLDDSNVRNIKIDKKALSTNPKKELVSYVIPKTKQVPSYVNDKKLIREPGDIKNPLGVKNRDEKFERPNAIKGEKGITADKGKTVDKKDPKTPKSPKTRSVDRPSMDSPKIQPSKPIEKPKEHFQKKNSVDRDFQFKRNESKESNRSPYSNPYYRGKNQGYERNDAPGKTGPWYRRPSNDPYSQRDNVDPKYRDEAKKYFERFDKNRNESGSYPKNYEPRYEPKRYEPSRNYEPPKKSYDAPKRDYKAPEVKSRSNSNSNRSNSNSNRSKPPSSNNSIKKKD